MLANREHLEASRRSSEARKCGASAIARECR
jgi:hypothetical protein